MGRDLPDRMVSTTSVIPGFMVTKHQRAVGIGDPTSSGWVTIRNERTWIGFLTWWKWREEGRP